MQRQFQDLDQVKIARQDVRFFAERARLDTAAAAALARVLQRLALPHLLLDHRVGVENRGKAVTVADHPQGVFQHRVRRLAGQLQVAAGLQQVQLVDDVQQQVRDLVRAVAAVGQQSGQVNVGKVRVSPAFGRRDAHFGRRRVVVELDEKRFQQFAGVLRRQRAVGQSSAVKRDQVLVQVTGAERIPAVQFRDHGQVAEPVRLQRFVKVPRGLRRHVAADIGDLFQFRLAGRIGFSRRHFGRQLGMPLGEQDHRVAGNVHRGQLFPFLISLRVAHEVQCRDGRADLAFEVHHPAAVDLVVQDRVPGRSLLHELRVQPGFIRLDPLVGHGREDLVPHAAVPPVRDDLLVVDPQRLVVHRIASLGAGIQDPQVFDRVAGEFGVGGHGFGFRTPFADDQFLVAQVNRLVLAQVQKRPSPHHGNRILAVVSPVEVRQQAGTFVRNLGLSRQAGLPQPRCSFVHKFNHQS